jgi:hypothetical protein
MLWPFASPIQVTEIQPNKEADAENILGQKICDQTLDTKVLSTKSHFSVRECQVLSYNND